MLQGVQGEDLTGFNNTIIADRSNGAPVPSVNNFEENLFYFSNYEKPTQRNADSSSFVSDIFVNSLSTFSIRETKDVTDVALEGKGSGINTVCVTNNVCDTAGLHAKVNLRTTSIRIKIESYPVLLTKDKVSSNVSKNANKSSDSSYTKVPSVIHSVNEPDIVSYVKMNSQRSNIRETKSDPDDVSHAKTKKQKINNSSEIKSLKCMYTNAEALVSKCDKLKIRVREKKPDIIFVSESWIQDHDSPSLYSLEGFACKTYANSREIRGGVCKYSKINLCVEDCTELNNMKVDDTLWLWIKCNEVRVLTGVIYRKNNRGRDINNKLLECIRKTSEMANGNLLICGDFNLPRINWQTQSTCQSRTSYSSEFLEMLTNCLLKQNVTLPTRRRGIDEPSLLDLIITDINAEVQDIEHGEPLGRSDHDVLSWKYFVKVQKIVTAPRYS